MFCELFCSLFISFKHLIGSFEGVYGRLRTVRQGADQRLSALLLARVKPGRECHPSTLIMTKLPGVRSPAQQSSVNAVLPLQAPRLQFYREKCVWTKIDISSNSLVPLTRSHSELFIDYLLRPRSSILHPLPYPLPPPFSSFALPSGVQFHHCHYCYGFDLNKVQVPQPLVNEDLDSLPLWHAGWPGKAFINFSASIISLVRIRDPLEFGGGHLADLWP